MLYLLRLSLKHKLRLQKRVQERKCLCFRYPGAISSQTWARWWARVNTFGAQFAHYSPDSSRVFVPSDLKCIYTATFASKKLESCKNASRNDNCPYLRHPGGSLKTKYWVDEGPGSPPLQFNSPIIPQILVVFLLLS